jgi:TubC N-terminal docking domain
VTPAELIVKLKAQGISLVAYGEWLRCRGKQSALTPEVLTELRQHKVELLALLGREPDYAATACVCPVPIGPTGNTRCPACQLPLICPGCGRCRGCKLRLKFPPEREPYG